MAGDDGKIYRATLGHFAQRAAAAALCEASEEPQACGIPQRLEEVGIEQIIHRPCTGGSLLGRERLSLAYLHHHANDNIPLVRVKDAVEKKTPCRCGGHPRQMPNRLRY